MSVVDKLDPSAFARMRVLADKLTSSCGPNEYWEEVDNLPHSDAVVLDKIALECQCCNLWFPVKEIKDVGGRYLCKDCV
jgi:hypothetical protein